MYSSLDLCSMITIHLGNGLANLSAAHLELFCHSSIMLILSLFPRSLLDAHWVCLHQILPLFCPQTGWERVLRKRHFVITIPLLFYLWTFYPSTRLDFTLAIVLWILRTFFLFSSLFSFLSYPLFKSKVINNFRWNVFAVTLQDNTVWMFWLIYFYKKQTASAICL